jgi:excisionase family DNA binding protein
MSRVQLHEPLMTVTEAGKALRKCWATVYEMISRGELAAIRIRGSTIIPEREVRQYLANCQQITPRKAPK